MIGALRIVQGFNVRALNIQGFNIQGFRRGLPGPDVTPGME